jgi:hypothetical protein
MGMFDELNCEYPLPDAEVQDKLFQTKSLECLMERYTISRDGRLIHHKVRYEAVPEEERPYWGTPEWDESPLTRMIGFLKAVPVGNVEVAYHGDIYFGTTVGSREEGNLEWYEYQARFTEGRIQWIRRVERG